MQLWKQSPASNPGYSWGNTFGGKQYNTIIHLPSWYPGIIYFFSLPAKCTHFLAKQPHIPGTK